VASRHVGILGTASTRSVEHRPCATSQRRKHRTIVVTQPADAGACCRMYSSTNLRTPAASSPVGSSPTGPSSAWTTGKRAGNRRCGQAAPVAHPRAVLGHQRRTCRLRHGRGHDARFAQVPQERVDSERHTLVATALAAAAPAPGQVTHKTREQILVEIRDGHAAPRGPLAQVVSGLQVGAARLGRVSISSAARGAMGRSPCCLTLRSCWSGSRCWCRGRGRTCSCTTGCSPRMPRGD